MITNEEFQSKLAGILQQLQELEQYHMHMNFSIPDEYKGIYTLFVDIDVNDNFILPTTFTGFSILVEASDIEQSYKHLKLTLVDKPSGRELVCLPFVDNNQSAFTEAYRYLSTQINYFANQTIEAI